MNKIKLKDDEITYKNDKIELSMINLKNLNEIVVENLNNELVVEIDDDLTSPNTIFLKTLKREIDEDFKSEMES